MSLLVSKNIGKIADFLRFPRRNFPLVFLHRRRDEINLRLPRGKFTGRASPIHHPRWPQWPLPGQETRGRACRRCIRLAASFLPNGYKARSSALFTRESLASSENLSKNNRADRTPRTQMRSLVRVNFFGRLRKGGPLCSASTCLRQIITRPLVTRANQRDASQQRTHCSFGIIILS